MTDFRALCEELTDRLQHAITSAHADSYYGENRDAVDRARAALAQPEPQGPPVEPRGCPTPGACSCPTAPTVPPELIRALELAEAGLADIGDADRKPGDDLAWAEARAAQDLPRIRRILDMWRDHATQHEPQGPTDEELKQLLFDDYRGVIEFVCDVEEEAHVMAGSHVQFARAVLTRWGCPAIEPVPVAERLPGPGDCDAEGRCWWLRSMGLNPVWDFCKRQGFVTHSLPHHALPLPTTDGQADG